MLGILALVALTWLTVLALLARSLGRPLRAWEGLLAWCLSLAVACPWLLRSTLFLPVNGTVSRNVPGIEAAQARDKYDVYNDVVLQLVPWELEVRRAVGSGRLPFWSDLVDGAGGSLWSNPQAAVAAPTALLARLAPVEHSFLLHFILKGLTGAVGAWVLARLVGLRRGTSWLAGASFGMSGGIVTWALFPFGSVVAWTPWIGAAAIATVRRGQRAHLIVGSLVACSILLSGHPEAAIAAASMSSGLALGFVRTRSTRCERAARVASHAASWLLGAMLAGPFLVPQGFQILSSLRAVSGPNRAAESLAQDAGWFPGRSEGLLTAPLAPRMFGRALELESSPPAPWPVTGSCYVGFLVGVGLPTALILVRSRRLWLLFGAALLVFLLGAGFTPLMTLASRVPLLNALAFSRWLPMGSLLLLLVGVTGVDRMVRRRDRRSLAVGLSAAVLMAVAGGSPGLVAALALSLVGFFIAPKMRATLMFVAVVIEVLSWGWDYLPKGSRELYYPRTPFIRVLQDLHESHPGSRVIGAGFTVYPAVLSPYQIADARVNNPVALASYTEVLGAALGFRPETSRYKGAVRNLESPLIDFLGVAIIAAKQGTQIPTSWRRVDPGFEPIHLYANPSWLPRWFVPNRVLTRPPGRVVETAVRLRDARSVVVSDPYPTVQPEIHASVSYTGGDGEFSIALRPGKARLVASSVAFAPGWRARADHRELRLVRINGAFLGFVADSGVTRVRIAYRPAGIAVGCVMALAALALLAGFVVAERRQPARRRRAIVAASDPQV